MSVHDVTGRLVQRMPARWLVNGEAEAEWDGLDAAGRRVPNGVYFVRVRAAGLEATGRAIRAEGFAGLAAGGTSGQARLPAPAPSLQPFNVPPDEGGGGSPPPDTLTMMNMIIPFLQFDAIGDSLKLNVSGAQAAGVIAEAIQIGRDLVRAVNRTADVWIDDYRVSEGGWPVRFLPWTNALNDLYEGCAIDEIPCGQPYHNEYQGVDCPFQSKASVWLHLLNQGYHPTFTPFALWVDTKQGTSWARDICGDVGCMHPGNEQECPCGLLREEAKIWPVEECGCWTYSTSCPEPDPEPQLINNDPVLTSLWFFYVKLWHDKC